MNTIAARAWSLAGLAFLWAGCAGVEIRAMRIRRLTVDEAHRTLPMPGTYILDVSPPADYDDAHLLGAHSIPYNQLWRRMDELPADKDAPILIYDADGERSMKAGLKLKDEGYSRLYELIGGRAIWKARGLPVTRQPAVPPEFEGGWREAPTGAP